MLHRFRGGVVPRPRRPLLPTHAARLAEAIPARIEGARRFDLREALAPIGELVSVATATSMTQAVALNKAAKAATRRPRRRSVSCRKLIEARG